MSPGSKRAGYDPEPFVAFVTRLLEERNETYREAAMRAGLDRSSVWRFLHQEVRPHRDACILLAQHFQVNPNEMLALGGYEPIALFDLSLSSADEFPPEVKTLARSLTAIANIEKRRRVCMLLGELVDLVEQKG